MMQCKYSYVTRSNSCKRFKVELKYIEACEWMEHSLGLLGVGCCSVWFVLHAYRSHTAGLSFWRHMPLPKVAHWLVARQQRSHTRRGTAHARREGSGRQGAALPEFETDRWKVSDDQRLERHRRTGLAHPGTGSTGSPPVSRLVASACYANC